MSSAPRGVSAFRLAFRVSAFQPLWTGLRFAFQRFSPYGPACLSRFSVSAFTLGFNHHVSRFMTLCLPGFGMTSGRRA